MGSAPERTIWWDADAAGVGAPVCVIDQRALPHALVVECWHRVEECAAGIRDMQVRGAPLIGVAAAYGMALAARHDPSDDGLRAAAALLGATRPTAVNLMWALERVLAAALAVAPVERAAVLAALAVELADEDAAACRRIGETGADLLAEMHGRTGRPVQVLTHCNAGRLACIEFGTATAPVYTAVARGVPVHVWVSETRPRNQGAALTAWELADAGVDHTLVVDNAAAHLMASGLVDCVIVGADRVAANGDVANKIGTALKACAAAQWSVPFYVALPWSTYDPACPQGSAIPIEERDEAEVLVVNGAPIAPAATRARNWGFDVTPAALVTGYLTPAGRCDVAALRAWGSDRPVS